MSWGLEEISPEFWLNSSALIQHALRLSSSSLSLKILVLALWLAMDVKSFKRQLKQPFGPNLLARMVMYCQGGCGPPVHKKADGGDTR